MDEIKGDILNKNGYGRKERNEFLDWFSAQVEKARTDLDKEVELEGEKARDSTNYIMKEEYYNFVDYHFGEENGYLDLFDSENGRVQELQDFKDRLLDIREAYYNEIVGHWNNENIQMTFIPGGNLMSGIVKEISKLDKEMAAIKNPGAEHEEKAPDLNDSWSSGFKAHDNKAEEDSLEEADTLIEEQRANVLKCAKLLRSSKTLVNSKEYNDLIDIMEKIGNGMTQPINGKSPREQFAQELYAIHIQTEKYLDHKARDGVKRNTYNKLMAVERTNRMLEECIAGLGNISVNAVDGGTKGLNELPVSFDARQQAAGTRYTPVPNGRELAKAFKQNNPEYKDVSTTVIAKSIGSVDRCMCEIMMKAEMNRNPVALESLKSARQSFLDKPFSPLKKEPEAAPQVKKPGKSAVK